MLRRREFLGLALSGFMLKATASTGRFASGREHEAVFRLLQSIYWDDEVNAELARAYILQSGEGTEEQHLASIVSLLSSKNISTFLDAYLILEEKIADDFRQENVVSVQGWRLANTELSICLILTNG